MPTQSGRESLMDAICAGKKPNFLTGNRHYTFDKPMKSMVDGSTHHDMASYEKHLKDKGYFIVGDDSSLYKTAYGEDLKEHKQKMVEDKLKKEKV